MEHSDIEHMAQGYPPAHIAKDSEEVTVWLATQLLETQEQSDALAAENAALKNFAWSEVVAADQEKQDRWMMECTGARDRFISMQTPATDAYLNSVRAEGALLVAERMRKARYVFKDMHHGVVSECADIAVDVAKKLRAGDPS